jgi:hypothetical protein
MTRGPNAGNPNLSSWISTEVSTHTCGPGSTCGACQTGPDLRPSHSDSNRRKIGTRFVSKKPRKSGNGPPRLFLIVLRQTRINPDDRSAGTRQRPVRRKNEREPHKPGASARRLIYALPFRRITRTIQEESPPITADGRASYWDRSCGLLLPRCGSKDSRTGGLAISRNETHGFAPRPRSRFAFFRCMPNTQTYVTCRGGQADFRGARRMKDEG